MDIKTGEHSYDNTKIAEYVARWGKADSIALFDPRFIIFSAPPIEGVIGYRVEAQCAIVIADPIRAPEDVPALTKAFHDFCAERYKTVIYVMASEPFTQWAVGTVCKRAISIGNEVILDPTIDIKTGNGSSVRRLRNKYNHALRAGVDIKEYVGNDLYTEQSMEQLRNQWLQNREGMQIYHSEINLFAHRMGRRWFCGASISRNYCRNDNTQPH